MPIGYGVAVLSIGMALIAGYVLDVLLDFTPSVSLFLCAILFAAWFGGVGPGLLATVLTVLAFDYFFMAPVGTLVLPWKDVPRLAFFAIAALFVVMMSSAQRRTAESLRQARDNLQAVVQNLDRLNKEMQGENAERRRAERELQLIVDTIPVMAASYRPDGSLDFVNKVWRDYTGLSLENLEHHRWGAAIHPDDQPLVERAWRDHLATGQPFQLEQRMRRADGEYRWHLIVRVPLRDESGQVIRWYGAGYDIEDQKRALDALRRSQADLAQAERELKLIVDTIPVMVRRFTADGAPDYANRTSSDFAGIPPEQQSDQGVWSDTVHPDDRDAVGRIWQVHHRDGTPFEIECRLRRFDGEYRRVIARRVPLRDESGEVVRWYGAAIDIEDQKRATEALRRSEAGLADAERELQLIIDTIPVIVGRYRQDGSPDFVNKTAREFTGLSLEDLRDRRWAITIHPDDLPVVDREWRAHLETGEPLQIEYRLRRADGEYRWQSVRRVPLRDEKGEVIRWYGAGYDIEDYKRAAAALQRSEAELAEAKRELQLLIDTIPVLVMRFGPDGKSDFVNRTAFDFTGVEPDGSPNDQWAMAVHPDDLEPLVREWRVHLQSGEPFETEYRLRRADGEYRRLLVRRVPLRDRNGTLIRWYGAGYDIEDYKRAVAALERSEAELAEAKRELQLIVDTIPVMVRRFNADGMPDFVNKTAWEFTGIPPEDQPSVGRWQIADHPDDRQALESQWREHLRTGEPFDCEFRLRRADGVYRWVYSRRVPLRDENGKVVKWYAAGYDIEEQKRAMVALQESQAELAKAERELKLIVDTIPAMVTRYRADSTVDFVNKRWREFTGLSPDNYVDERWKYAIHPDDLPAVARVWQEHLAAKQPFETVARVLHAGGGYRWCLNRRVPLCDENGDVINWYGVAHDIEDQKRAEYALRRSEAYLDEAQKLSQTGSFGWNMSDGSVVWSKEAYRIVDIDPSATPTLGLVLERTHPDDRELVRQQILRARDDEEGYDYEYEHRLLRPDGSIRQLHVHARRIKYESGEEELVGALMDITAAREAEQALHEAQTQLAHATRMTTLGEMSASIAHEINQPLAAIITNGEAGLRWLNRDRPDLDEARSAVGQIVDSANRAGQVIRRIRNFARRAGTELIRLDANDVIEEAVGFLQRDAAGSRVTLKLQLAPDLPPVRADRIQLQQIVINLVANGIQAMATVADRARVLAIRTQAHEPDHVLVAVQDAGIGIAPESLDRLFSAFYTTKPDGMGIGLSICRSIVEAHGGRVWASPNTGPGMTFQFTLPAYPQDG